MYRKILILIVFCSSLVLSASCIHSASRDQEKEEDQGQKQDLDGEKDLKQVQSQGGGKILFVFNEDFSCDKQNKSINQSKSMDQNQVANYAISSLNKALFNSKATSQEEIFDTQPVVQAQT